MSYFSIFILAFALSIDAFVVSFSYGLCLEKGKRITALALAVTTGFFQAIMPIFGYFLGSLVKQYISPYSKLVIFTIFMYLGINFIIESFKKNKLKKSCPNIDKLLLIGIATSIDALSAGIPLMLTNSPILIATTTIGIVTFINSILGYLLGYIIKKFNMIYIELLGGIILIWLAINNLFN